MTLRRSVRPYLIATVIVVLAVAGWSLAIKLSVYVGDWTQRGFVTGGGLILVVALILILRTVERRDFRRTDQDQVERRRRRARARDRDAGSDASP